MATCEISLHLRIKVKPEQREALLAFLCEARPFYEQPGGITMRLLENRSDPNAFIEVFEYESVAAYEADDRRVREDPQQRAYIERWRSLLDGPPVVEVYAARSLKKVELHGIPQ
jgi:quinol monooxygenase YgiN